MVGEIQFVFSGDNVGLKVENVTGAQLLEALRILSHRIGKELPLPIVLSVVAEGITDETLSKMMN